jgi:hypothetical protein
VSDQAAGFFADEADIMKIDCLMGTYGRHALACEALACFLQQSELSNATLLVYNQHPVPLRVDHPKVRVVNEMLPAVSLRHIRKRMLELSDPSADLIHWWDDDDLYLPWHLKDCLDHVGTNVAWKPASSWMSLANVTYSREANVFEGSWVFRAGDLKAAALDAHPDYPDHPITWGMLQTGKVATTDLGGRTSYIYRWATGTEHLSAYGPGSEEMQRRHVELWRERSNDVSADGRLVPADMTARWRQYLDGIKGQVTPVEWELNRKGVGLP